MAELHLGNPSVLAVDVGPVIDAQARETIERHVTAMRARGHRVHQGAREVPADTARGTFVAPTLIELDSLSELQREVFGPVLHVVRYRRRDLHALLGQINATGYGLTLGVHTRIDETIAQVVEHARAGNVYVNRNMVGAVVGVQPFGGEGLSGTGPKAGGPLYLYRLLATHPADALVRAWATVCPADAASARAETPPRAALAALRDWARRQGRTALAAQCERDAERSSCGRACALSGPTGERNVYTIGPRESVLCLADADADRLAQLAAVLCVGSAAVWPSDAATARLQASLPPEVQASIANAHDWSAATVRFDVVLHHGDGAALQPILRMLAARAGPLVAVRAYAPGDAEIALEGLVVERALSVNTAAAGGNASLMTIG
jgi:RHH-type proline utilization regulon transcriptional repressor/proline dehydrogenase/delta 1-pyrroline-5-carboxylate dehydrogenase